MCEECQENVMKVVKKKKIEKHSEHIQCVGDMYMYIVGHWRAQSITSQILLGRQTQNEHCSERYI